MRKYKNAKVFQYGLEIISGELFIHKHEKEGMYYIYTIQENEIRLDAEMSKVGICIKGIYEPLTNNEIVKFSLYFDNI